jgi:hypothetical protein
MPSSAVLAVIDESTPTDSRGHVHYILGVSFVATELVAAGERLTTLLDRQRPFHWSADRGSIVRKNVIQFILDHDVRSHVGVHYPTRAREQERARARLLTEVVLPAILDVGASEFWLELRAHDQDSVDKLVVRNWLRDQRVRLPYAWHPKAEPLLWIADAVAGAVADQRLERDTRWFDQLQDADLLTVRQLR